MRSDVIALAPFAGRSEIVGLVVPGVSVADGVRQVYVASYVEAVEILMLLIAIILPRRLESVNHT